MSPVERFPLVTDFPGLYEWLVPLLEYEAEDGELDQHGNQHDEWWGDESVDTHPEEDVEEDDMQEVVHTMTACKPDEVLPGGSGMEGKVVRGNEVIDKADEIACCIGDIHINP